MSLDQIIKTVCHEEKRPAIDESWDSSIRLLILKSLDPNPQQRPTFLKVLEVLNEFSQQ